jgi:hypothetical protein
MAMSTISHEPSAVVDKPSWIDARNMWASIAIVAIWLAVLLATLYGPDLEAVEVTGERVTIPSGLGLAFFALFATVAVAKYGFERKPATG